ncbi:gamma-aminobutyric acid receptor subunit rho-2-like [Mercenaria mercenaria]|uniref:gamma-aminobutyric acid receptor subunit rho-2-like n=1 Tax=Mercenaria mercenaria TaxID=6596 RepID=UPI00234ECBC3|nr:gamma-aminobutyric acid receptor subunit rho-2-like [Mercenaria mercenaria]
MLLDKRCMAKEYLKFFLCILTASVTSGAHVEPTRYDLIHYLLSDTRYDHSLPPDFYTGSVTNVSVEMVITDLNYESDINMEYDCTLYLRLNWTDRRLDFSVNSTSYESLKLGDDIVDKIWIPDLFFHHERKSELHGLFTKNQLVYIFRNGSVLYSGRFNVKSNCQMDLKKYPFDTQTCPIVIQSYAFTKEDIMLHWNGKNAVKIDHTANLDFIEKSLKHTYISPYADPVGNFSTLVAKISFKRPKESFQIMYVAPAIILVSVSFTSFL